MTAPGTRPRFSKVEGVDMPRTEFMRKVSELKVGEIGVAMNHPKTVAYVIRVAEINPSEEFLQTQFQSDREFTYQAVGREDQSRIFRAWQEELENTAGLKWVESAAVRPRESP